MLFDEQKWRPITFQGVKFPATLMGVSILEPVLCIADEELADWLWRLPICCGIEKRAPAEVCARSAQKTVDLMLEHREQILDGIRGRLGPHGFDADTTYRDWIVAFQRIVSLSAGAEGKCVWSAPLHPNDKPFDPKNFIDALDREKARLDESEGDSRSDKH